MVKRRSLVAGMKPPAKSDPRKEEAFVYGKPKPAREKKPAKPAAQEPRPSTPEPITPPLAPQMPQQAGRVPLTTRVRPELANALKRASLERQLAGQLPNSVQDILEQALEPWLRDQGYLK
jgi:hypothetical protein